ncbi:MAG: hypothetical protein RL011_1462 [Pseudomonadota bacterium]|jgi:hypothetical protein
MKCIEMFPTIEQAKEKLPVLKSRGIDARLVVDPLESMAPALADMSGVGISVPDASAVEAYEVLHPVYKKAS